MSEGQNSEDEQHQFPVPVPGQGKERLVASDSSKNGTVLLSGKHDTNKTSNGYVENFVMNRRAKRLLPCVRVTWRHHIGARGVELLLNYTQTDARQ